MNISEAFIDFSKPTTLLSGSNGSGKSSIVEAIAICFLERKRSDTFKDYVKYGETESEIKLAATIDKDIITFDVKLSSSGSTEKDVMYKNVKYHNSEVSGLLDSLGFNYYGDLLFSMQGSSDITVLSPTQRLNYLKNLLNFDYSQAIEKIEESLNASKNEYQKISNEIEFLEKSIESRQLEIKETKDLPFTEKEIENFQKKIDSYNQKLNEYNEALKKSKENSDKIIELQNQINISNNSIKDYEYKISSLEEKLSNQQKYKSSLEKTTEELSSVQKEIEALNQTSSEQQKSISEITLNQDHLNNDISNIKSQIDKITDRIENLHNESTAIRGDSTKLIDLFHNLSEENVRNKNLKIDINSKEKSIDLAKDGKCPTCGNIFTDEHKNLLKKELDNLIVEFNNSNTKLGTIKDACKDILNKSKIDLTNKQTALVQDQTLYKDQLTKLQKELSILQENRLLLNSKKLSLENTISELKDNIIDTSETEKNIVAYKDNIKKLNEDIVNFNKEISLKSFTIDIVEPDKSEYNNATQSINTQTMTENENNLILSANNAAKSFISQSRENIEKNKTKLTDIDNNIDIYKNAKQIFEKNLPNFLVVKTCSKIQSTMNSFIQSIFPNIEVRLFHSKKGVEFYYTTCCSSLTDEEKTKENMLNIKMASGFEKAILTIAFKEALCKAYSLPFCVLDEVDAAASEENSERLFNSIVCGGFFQQSIIITHKPVVRDIIKQLADTNSYTVSNGEFTLE